MRSPRTGTLVIQPLGGIPLVKAGDDIAGLILSALNVSGLALVTGDILIIAQKIVSKSEGRSVSLSSVVPSDRAKQLAAIAQKDPRLVELILHEAREIIRVRPGLIIVENKSGVILANAGIDRSNVADGEALLLPIDSDASANQIRETLHAKSGIDAGILIIDSIGRAWRNGTVGTAIGASGVTTLSDLRGRPDLFGRKLETTEVGWGDELAAAASIVMGQADEGCPVVLARGVDMAGNGSARQLLRARGKDLFR
jgi:coenzyme F420-0:L-glutamate ligase / coenzyme F420-1:gamma-L-glutamate ligase